MNQEKELIKVDLNRRINARELHNFLGSKQKFGNWINRKIQDYDFIERTDYIIKTWKSPGRSRPRTDYLLTITMAKEFCLVENNEKGKQARLYLIEVEKRFKNMTQALKIPLSIEEILSQNVQILIQHREQLNQIENRIVLIEKDKRKAEDEWRTIKGPSINPPSRSTRSLFNELVRLYCNKNNADYKTIYRRIYRQFYYLYHVNLALRAKNQELSTVEYAERDGFMEDLYAVACNLLSPIAEEGSQTLKE